VPVEKPLIRDECARQERNSNGCDGCLRDYSRPERLPAPVMHRRHILQNLTSTFLSNAVMADHAATEHCGYKHPITARSPVSQKT
jgi:hypothetical protein